MIRKIMVCGAIGRHEMRYTSDGTAVMNVGIGTKLYKEDDTIWLEAELWGARAEALNNHIDRAKTLHATGDLVVEEFTRNNGSTGYRLKLKRADVQIVGWKPDEEQPARPRASERSERYANSERNQPTRAHPFRRQRNQPEQIEEHDEIPF